MLCDGEYSRLAIFGKLENSIEASRLVTSRTRRDKFKSMWQVIPAAGEYRALIASRRSRGGEEDLRGLNTRFENVSTIREQHRRPSSDSLLALAARIK